MQIAGEISATYPEIKQIYMGQGTRIRVDSLKMTPCLIVKVQTDSLMSSSSLEQFKRWLKIRLQVDEVEVDNTLIE